MKIKSGDQALMDGHRVEVVEPYKVKHYWVVRIISGEYTGQTRVVSAGTLLTFRVKAIKVVNHENT